jgi:hypothetical protein
MLTLRPELICGTSESQPSTKTVVAKMQKVRI